MASWPPLHPGEECGNAVRQALAEVEPRSLRTLTPSLAVISHSAGIFHWTVDGRKLYDFTSGVLVTNLGHNPPRWLARLRELLGWDAGQPIPMNAYNAVTPIEVEVSRRLLELLCAPPSKPGALATGDNPHPSLALRAAKNATIPSEPESLATVPTAPSLTLPAPNDVKYHRIVWAASGSEAVHKALWACLRHTPGRDQILATRRGFHGKKGLANAVTGSESDPERDPRVHFVGFPMEECHDVSHRNSPFYPQPYIDELTTTFNKVNGQVCEFITEPYLGGGGSYHPPTAYLQAVREWCRAHDVTFILDEVQANFGRCGTLFAFQKYGIDPDIVVLGKSLGNGVPVAAIAGRADLLDPLQFGETSDTWSANPLATAAVLAVVEQYADPHLLPHVHKVSAIIESGLVKLKQLPYINHVRGEEGGMVWGVECRDHAGVSAADWALRLVRHAYLGNGNEGIHLLGPLAGTVIRIAPPLVITAEEAAAALELLSSSAHAAVNDT